MRWVESAARRFEGRGTSRWETPGAMAQHFDPRTIQTPALELIDKLLVEAFRTPDSRTIISMAPQEGKSQRVSRWFPLWAMDQNHDLRVIMTSYEAGMSRRHGRWVRNMIVTHGRELRLNLKQDVKAQHEWELAGADGGIVTAGVDGAITGRPGDLLIIDDPIKNRAEAESKTVRENIWEFWTDSASTRLSPGAPVVLIMTRWHHDDLVGRLKAAEDGDLWRVLNIPAQADHKPEEGETDPLGREPGEYMISARGRTKEQWDAKKITVGPRTWNALYQGRPSTDQGGLFPRDKWQRYDTPMWITRPDGANIFLGAISEDLEIAQSWDMAFKDTAKSDFVVGQVWLRMGTTMYLLDQYRERTDFNGALRAVKEMSAKWPQAVAKFIEDKANGPAIINALNREMIGLIPIEPEGSKYARASAVSPLMHAGNIVIPEPELAPWVVNFVEECKDFPYGAHDDQVDAMSQAGNRMLLMPLMGFEEEVQVADEFEDLDIRGYSISPY